MTTRLDHISGSTIIPEGAFGISPSQVYNFITRPHEWYRSQILNEVTFEGNTSSILGTIVHFCAECYCKTAQVTDDDKAEIQKYLETQQVKLEDTVDFDYVNIQWPIMAETLINYLINTGVPTRSEELIHQPIDIGGVPMVLKDNMFPIHAAGSADAVLGTTLIDFKTTSIMTPKSEIPIYYKYQLLTYAYIYNKLGIPIDTIRILWITNNNVGRISPKTGKPMKNYPSTVIPASEVITQDDMDFIESILKLIGETVQFSRSHPELDYIIYKDYRLKGIS